MERHRRFRAAPIPAAQAALAALATPAARLPPAQQTSAKPKAKSVALSHAGISESGTSYIYAKKDWDDGRWVYDVEFWADGKEYDYEILASDGTILSYDYDAEYQWSGSTGTSGDTISTEKVKSIVTDRAGVSGTFRELKLERDDGRTVYEGEMRSGRTDYEFTIDAYTGAVLEWDTDWDD